MLDILPFEPEYYNDYTDNIAFDHEGNCLSVGTLHRGKCLSVGAELAMPKDQQDDKPNIIDQLCDYYDDLHDALDRKFGNISLPDLNFATANALRGNGLPPLFIPSYGPSVDGKTKKNYIDLKYFPDFNNYGWKTETKQVTYNINHATITTSQTAYLSTGGMYFTVGDVHIDMESPAEIYCRTLQGVLDYIYDRSGITQSYFEYFGIVLRGLVNDGVLININLEDYRTREDYHTINIKDMHSRGNVKLENLLNKIDRENGYLFFYSEDSGYMGHYLIDLFNFPIIDLFQAGYDTKILGQRPYNSKIKYGNIGLYSGVIYKEWDDENHTGTVAIVQYANDDDRDKPRPEMTFKSRVELLPGRERVVQIRDQSGETKYYWICDGFRFWGEEENVWKGPDGDCYIRTVSMSDRMGSPNNIILLEPNSNHIEKQIYKNIYLGETDYDYIWVENEYYQQEYISLDMIDESFPGYEDLANFNSWFWINTLGANGPEWDQSGRRTIDFKYINFAENNHYAPYDADDYRYFLWYFNEDKWHPHRLEWNKFKQYVVSDYTGLHPDEEKVKSYNEWENYWGTLEYNYLMKGENPGVDLYNYINVYNKWDSEWSLTFWNRAFSILGFTQGTFINYWEEHIGMPIHGPDGKSMAQVTLEKFPEILTEVPEQ